MRSIASSNVTRSMVRVPMRRRLGLTGTVLPCRMSPIRAGVLLLMSCAAAAQPGGDPCAAMGIPAGRCTRWNPGIPGGIPRRTAVCANIGAQFGDGKRDAADAIQNALDVCREGGVVELAAGNFRIGRSLVLNKDVVLRGQGPEHSRIRLDAAKGPVAFIARLWPEYRTPPVDVTADLPQESSSIPVAHPGTQLFTCR